MAAKAPGARQEEAAAPYLAPALEPPLAGLAPELADVLRAKEGPRVGTAGGRARSPST